MSTLPEFVGTIHIFLGPYRGNPIALYLRQEGEFCEISPTIYPWNRFKGVGETVNKAAANFDLKWKEGDLTPDMYSGPHWEGGIKPEKPKPPPKPPAAPKPETTEAAKPETTAAIPAKTETASTEPVAPSPTATASSDNVPPSSSTTTALPSESSPTPPAPAQAPSSEKPPE